MTTAYNLLKKFDKYSSLIKAHQDPNGFIEYNHCDSLLFTALIGCIPSIAPTINIEQARDPETGLWHRRDYTRPCYSCGVDKGSKSTISRDMLLGLAWYCWFNKRGDLAEGIVQYALKNWGVMGEGELSRTWIGPQLLGTFAWLSWKLGGPRRKWLTWIPIIVSGGRNKQLPYQRHLEVLHIALRGEIGMSVSENCKAALQSHFRFCPQNPLFAWAIGRNDFATKTLKELRFYPEERLPNSFDRSSSWLPMRDLNDWVGETKGTPEEHTGGDFLFVYWLVTKGVKSW